MSGVDFTSFSMSGVRLDTEQAVLHALAYGAKVD